MVSMAIDVYHFGHWNMNWYHYRSMNLIEHFSPNQTQSMDN